MKLFFIALIFSSSPAFCQHSGCVSTILTVNGAIKNEWALSLSQLDTMRLMSIPDVVIKNHTGEVKRTLSNLNGVAIQELLQNVTITAGSPKVLSEYYLVFTACDGYKVVFSWNELFNNKSGKHVYLFKEKNGTTLSIITPMDDMTGRRYVQSISTITIKRAE